MRDEKTLNQKQLQILEAAEELIARNGYKGASVREICLHAKINVAMISYYFGSKDKMMYQLYQYRIRKTKEDFGYLAQTVSLATPIQQMKEIVNFIISQIIKFYYFHGFVTHQYRTPNTNKYLVDFYKICILRFEDIIQKGISRGVFGKAVLPEDLLATILGTIIFTVRNPSLYGIEDTGDTEDFEAKVKDRLMKYLKQTVFSLLDYQENEN